MGDQAQRWIEETVDPVTGEPLVFQAATEADLDAQIAARFGEDSSTAGPQPDDVADPCQRRSG